MLSGRVLWKKSASSPENNMAEEGKVIKHFKFVFVRSFSISLVNEVSNNYFADTFLPQIFRNASYICNTWNRNEISFLPAEEARQIWRWILKCSGRSWRIWRRVKLRTTTNVESHKLLTVVLQPFEYKNLKLEFWVHVETQLCSWRWLKYM